MNPDDPQKLEDIDPTVLAEIESEFAAITTEIQRISALPESHAPKKPAMLAALRAEWQRKADARDPNRPEWRKSLDIALDRAVEKLVADSIVEMPDGQMAFEMNNQALQSEAPPVMKALLGGFTAMLQEKLKPVPGAPPNPWAPLLQSMALMFGKAISQIEMPKSQPPSDATSAPSDAPPTEPRKKDPDAPLAGEGIQLQVNLPLDAKIEITQKGEPAPALTEPSPAGQEFFANLMQGLGHFIQTSFKPGVSPPSPAPAPAATDAATPTPAPAPDPETKPDPMVATVSLDVADAPKEGPQPTVKIDVQGLLAQILKGITQPKK